MASSANHQHLHRYIRYETLLEDRWGRRLVEGQV